MPVAKYSVAAVPRLETQSLRWTDQFCYESNRELPWFLFGVKLVSKDGLVIFDLVTADGVAIHLVVKKRNGELNREDDATFI